LHHFLDEKYLTERPLIRFVANDHVSEFEIFSARQTDVSDPAYKLDFPDPDSWESFLTRNGAPKGAEQIITLSTCIGTDNDRRMIVQGVLRQIVQVTTEQKEDGGWRIVQPPE